VGEIELLPADLFYDMTVNHGDAQFRRQIIENPDIMVADNPCYFYAGVSQLGDLPEESDESFRHYVFVFEPVIEDITEEEDLLCIGSYFVKKPADDFLVPSGGLKVFRTEMEVGDKISVLAGHCE